MALRCIREVYRLAPNGARIVIVDDCSDDPIAPAIAAHLPAARDGDEPDPPTILTTRNHQRRGVAYSKNICLELLDDCDYIFLLDDDIHPVSQRWTDLFLRMQEATGIQHFSLVWKYETRQAAVGGIEYLQARHASGVMNFFTRKAIQAAGGNDLRFGLWGHEHIELSLRIHNQGLTPAPFCVVPDSGSLFWVQDRDVGGSESSVSAAVKQALNTPLLDAERESTAYKPYKRGDFVMGAHLTSHIGRRRSIHQTAADRGVRTWAGALKAHGMTGILFVDEVDIEPTEWVKVIRVRPAGGTEPCRWTLYRKWLEMARPYCRSVWLTGLTELTVIDGAILSSPPPHERRYRVLSGIGCVGGDPDLAYRICGNMAAACGSSPGACAASHGTPPWTTG